MISNEIARAIVFSLPFGAALVCLILSLIDLARPVHRIRGQIRMCAIIMYSAISLVWTGLILHEIAPSAFLSVMWLFVPLYMASYVFVYRNMHTNTRRGDGKPFSYWHLTGPALMLATMVAATLLTPGERVEEIVYGYRLNVAEYLIVGVAIAFSCVYRILGLIRITRFKHSAVGCPVDGSHQNTCNWIFWAMIIEMLVLPLSVCGLFLGWPLFTGLGFAWIIAVIPSVVIYLVICYNLFSDNYVVIDDAPKREPLAPESAMRLRRDRLEQYLETKKPWLNPEFRITDMAEDLFTNRAYISAFINREYEMNFNRLVNGYRLREVDRLRDEATQRNLHVSSLQLIMNAGFNSYRSYLRAKSAENGNDSGNTPPPKSEGSVKPAEVK